MFSSQCQESLQPALNHPQPPVRAAGTKLVANRQLRRTLALLLVLAAAVALPASAAELTIYPGVGVGKVELGMTRAQVVRVLGKDYIVNGREGNAAEIAVGLFDARFQRRVHAGGAIGIDAAGRRGSAS